MTIEYSPATATAVSSGATDAGHVETDGLVTWDGTVSRYNNQSVLQQVSALALYQRDSDASLRRALMPTPTKTTKIMAVGDSITVGYGSADNAGYRPWLAALIGFQGIWATMSMHAHGGWTLADAKPGLAAALTTNTPDIVVVNLGTNEWLPDTASQNAYQTAYGQMIDQVLASSSTVKMACAQIPISQVASMQPMEARANTAIAAAVNARLGTGRVVLSDQRATTEARWMLEATDGSNPPPGRWTFDGVHPTDAGYLQMAQSWLTAIKPWL